MKTRVLPYTASAVVVLLATLAAGCASVAVSNDAIDKNTASALGLEKGTFTVSNREDDGVKTTYLVNTNAGKKYSCYVTGGISVVGRVVSDAICNEVGKTGKTAKATAVTGSGNAPQACNALLKAAGKCD